jgi:hypothetical protein
MSVPKFVDQRLQKYWPTVPKVKGYSIHICQYASGWAETHIIMLVLKYNDQLLVSWDFSVASLIVLGQNGWIWAILRAENQSMYEAAPEINIQSLVMYIQLCMSTTGRRSNFPRFQGYRAGK